MLSRVLVVSIVGAVTLVPGQAQRQATVSVPQLILDNWADEEVPWIISDQERAAYHRLESDEERRTFIDIFWRLRDPKPETYRNEFREEHSRRMQWANESLGGWHTDRAMIYVRYGAPDEQEIHPVDATGVHREIWRYRFVEGIGPDFVLRFEDPDNTNNLRLISAPPEYPAPKMPETKLSEFIRQMKERHQ